ncbi:hypothetical protein [Nocardia cyriacigeorgica]|uniref:Uncharacterized protein n=1 Tax=Nocardia cyriacigeorgica TaxID=135487 RepID=A0A6P1DC73_9NOCA|nr:hypothetical protein [Nocardia cyriacigeorgica]NEW46390.1 hypothetical protein [Nocardia cyriacigeorgica]
MRLRTASVLVSAAIAGFGMIATGSAMAMPVGGGTHAAVPADGCPPPPLGPDGRPLPPPIGPDGKPLPPPIGADGKPCPPPVGPDGKPPQPPADR